MNTKKFIKSVDQLTNYYCLPGKGGDFRVVSEVGDYGIHFRTANQSKIIAFSNEDNKPFVYNGLCENDDELMTLIHKYLQCDEWKTPKKKWFKAVEANTISVDLDLENDNELPF